MTLSLLGFISVGDIYVLNLMQSIDLKKFKKIKVKWICNKKLFFF